MALVFRQLCDEATHTFTYLLGDSDSGESVLIDPVLEQVDRDLKLVKELGLRLCYIVETHVHADHITGAYKLSQTSGAKIVVGNGCGVSVADILIGHGENLQFGTYTLTALSTPGHTNGCMSFVCEGKVFTGDTLLIRGTGRTDFQEGSSEKLYESIVDKLFALPEDTIVYPGHDYNGRLCSTVGEEKNFNPRVGNAKSKQEFRKIMESLQLDPPAKIDVAVPANLKCGRTD